MNVRDRLRELMEDKTPANAASKAAERELHETGKTTYGGKSYTMPGTPIIQESSKPVSPYGQARGALLQGRGSALDRISGLLPTGAEAVAPGPSRATGGSLLPTGAAERINALPTGRTGYTDLIAERGTAQNQLSGLRQELNMAQRSRGMVGERSTKEIRAELAETEKALAALEERERDIPQEEKRERWIELAALDRPLTSAERAEARAAIQELRGDPFAGALRTLRGETEDQKDRVNLADALETRVSGRGAAAAGLVAEVPFLGKAAEAGVDKASEIAEGAGVANPYLREGANVYRDAPVEHPGAYQTGRGVMSLAELALLSGGVEKAAGALPGFKGLPRAAQNAIRSGLTFGAKGALDEASAGGDLGEIAKAGLIRGAAAAAGSGASDLAGKLGTGLLFKAGLQNAAPAVVLRDGLAGTAFAGANMGTTMALDPEYRPSGGEAAKDLAVAFAFSTLSSLAQTNARTQEAKARLEQDVNAMKQDYAAIVGGADGKVTVAALDDLAARSARMRETLGTTQYVGQQETVSGVYQFLDQLDDVVAGARANVSGLGESVVAGTTAAPPTPGELMRAGQVPATVTAKASEAGTTPVAAGLLTGKDAAGQNNPASTEEAGYSLGRDEAGNVFVQIDADILDGKPQSEWKGLVRAEIQRIFGQGIKLVRGTIFSNRKGRGEYSNGSYTRMLERTDPDMYADKLRMAAGSDGIVQNADGVTYEDASHLRSDDIVGFNRGKIIVSVRGSGYDGDVLTAIYSDGKEAFFDINNLSHREIKAASPERYTTLGGFTQTGNAAPDTTLPRGDTGVKGQDAQTEGPRFLPKGKGRDMKNAPVETEALGLPTASETDAVSQLRSDGSEAAAGSISTVPSLEEKVKGQDARTEGPRYLSDGKTAAGRAGREDTLSMTDEDRALWQAARERRKSEKEPTGAKEEYRGTPATDKLGIKIERPITDLGTSQSLRGLEKARYEAGAALNRLLKNSNASKAEYAFAQGIADGTYTIRQAPEGMNRVLLQEIATAVSLRNSYNQKVLQEKRSGDAFVFDARVQELIKNSDQKKSPGIVSLNINTMQRNNERVWGGDAGEINAELFDPVVTNEAERIRFVNRTLAQVEQYHLTAEESAAVQKLMEQAVTVDELRSDGYDAPRLAEAAKTLSGLYNDFYEAVNDFLVAHGYKEIGFQKNYAPHMQEEQVGTLQRYLQRMGFQVGVTELPTDIAGRTEAFRPGKQYDPYFQHRKGNKTEYDAVGGLESYVNYLSNVFYHTDDIQKLRRFNEALREKYSPAEVAAEIDRLNSLEDRLAEEDIGQGEIDHLLGLREEAYERSGNMSRFGSYVSVLDDYTNILAGKQSKLDRAVESMFGRRALNLGRNVQNAFSKAAILGNLSSAINQTVQLPQLTVEVGPQFVARAAYDVAMGATARAGFNQESDFLTGKVGIQGISEKTEKERLFDFAARPFEAVDDFASRLIVRSKYLEQVAAGKSHAEALKAADQFAARLVGSRMRGAKPVVFEQKNPFTKLVTTFQLEVANGWEHIVHDLPREARQIAETQGKMAAAKWIAGLAVGALLANFIANSIIKGITGREPVPFDGLGMAANFMASGYGMTKEDYMKALADGAAESVTGGRPLGTEAPSGAFNLPKAVSTLAEDAAEDVPYVGNITTMLGVTDGRLPLPQVWNKKLGAAAGNLGNAVFGEEEEEREKSLAQGLPGLGQGAMELASTWLPMGSQIKKTAQGAAALLRGGVYSGYGEDEKLDYNVDRDPANIARGLLFGKSALPETDAYYAGGMSALTAKQTGVYRQLRENGEEGEEAYQLIQRLRRTKKTEDGSETMERIRVLEDSALPEGQKAVVYYGMLASDTEREVMERLGVDGKDADEIFSTLVNIRRATDSEGKTDTNRKRDAIISARLTDRQKGILYEILISDGKKDEIREAMGVGLSFDDYLRTENEHHTIDAGKKSAGEKTTDFLHWMNEQGYTDQQVGAVRGAMPFYSHIPAGEVMYDKLVESGFSSDEAYSLSQALDGVSSIKGDDGVNLSASKKKKVAIDAATPGLSQEERRKIYELFNVSRQVWGYTPRNTRQASERGALELPKGREEKTTAPRNLQTAGEDRVSKYMLPK